MDIHIAGAQVLLQSGVVALAEGLLDGVLPVDIVGALGAVGHQDLNLAADLQGVLSPGGIQNQSVVGHGLLGGTDSDHIAVGVQDEVILGIEAGQGLGSVDVEMLHIHVHQGGGVQNVGLIVGLAADSDVQLVVLVAVHAGHGAGDDLGQGDVGAAAVLDVQDQIVGGDIVGKDHVGKVLGDGVGAVGQLAALVLGSVERDGLILLAVTVDLAQGLLEVQNVVHIAVVVVVDDLDLNAVQIELLAGLAVQVVVDDIGGVRLLLAVAVVHIELGIIGDGQAGALQVVLHGVLGAGGGLDDVLIILGGDAQDLGVGQDGGLLDVQGHGLAQVLHGGVHVELDLTGLRHTLVLGGVGSGGGVQDHVVQHGLAVLHRLVGVGLVQLGPLVADHNTLHLIHAVHGGQDGAGIGEGDGVAALVLLDHFHIQGVVDQQSRVVTVQGGGHVLGEVAEDAQSGGLGVDVDGPVGALEALDLGIVAGGHQQHLGGLNAGHAGAGIEGAVATAGDDAKGVAVVDVALGPVGGDVSQARGAVDIQSAVVGALVHDDGDHLRHLGTVHALGRRIGTIGLALDDTQRREHGNRILVHNLSTVGEIVVAHSGSADDHQANDHDDGQHQAESPFEVSHLGFSSF